MSSASQIVFKPQPGPQTKFLTTWANVVFYGGEAGGGKTFGLILGAARHISVPAFHAVIFRRHLVEVKMKGGLWDNAAEVYPLIGGQVREGEHEYRFARGATIGFAGMSEEKSKLRYQGSQIPWIGFDQLEHFTEGQFFYMLSRNRSTTGIPGKMLATLNPDPDHFARRMVDWWIYSEKDNVPRELWGYPNPEKQGRVRWFCQTAGDLLDWADTRAELIERHGPDCLPLSFTFIRARVTDNPALIEKDPGYIARLRALPLVDRLRLEGGNWDVRPAAGLFFKRGWFPIVDAAPANGETVRYWDRAATDASLPQAKDASWTAGVLMRKDSHGNYYILHVERFQGSPAKVEERIKAIASQDGPSVTIGIEQDPGQAGKAEAGYQVRGLAGYVVRLNPAVGDKGTRAKPWSSQAEGGNVYLVRGKWNDDFLREAENFDGTRECRSDQVDATSGAFFILNQPSQYGGW